MAATTDDQLPLTAAADALGVHYQTAYRWVRSGRLPAQLVDGKYLVLRPDLEALEAARRTPVAPTAPSRRRLDRQADRMHAALLAGDEAAARAIARRLADEGAPIVELIEAVLVPPLRSIGQGWHDGDVTIWEEHRASAIVERILGELTPNPRGRRRGTAVVAAVAGDRHALPSTMAAIALRDANWRVHHLGADMPSHELLGFCAEHEVDVAVISLTNGAVADLAEETAARMRAAGTPAIVGTPGRSLAELVDAAGAAVRRTSPS